MRDLFNRVVHFNQLNLDAWVKAQAAAVPAGSRVLDLGAGGGPYRELFSHCDYKTQDFCQLDSSQIIQGKYSPIDYVCDATSIPVGDAEFDVVLSTEVLEHVPRPIEVLKEISRILKPGGRLLLSAPLGSGIHQEPYHFYGGYTPYFYEKFFAEFGFFATEVIPKGGSFGHFAQWLIWYFKAANPFALNMGLLLQLALLPFYLLLLPAVIALFFYSRMVDRFDGARQFTGGYYVKAEKR